MNPTMSVQQTARLMQQKLHDIVPDFEIGPKAELVHAINRLKKERHAVILGHNYMEPALFHFVADYRGDSLELCHRAREADADIIVFCGVEFMAETAKVLNPTKTVLIPSQRAGCSLASSITAADVRRLKAMYPGVPVVTYINTYADVKAETDICCTSGNAVKVVNSLDSDTVIFLPDEYLAKNVARETGKRVIFPETSLGHAVQSHGSGDGLSRTFIGWHGKCEVHDQFTVEDIKNARAQYPNIVILAHPECPPEVVEAADFSGSTSAMIRYVKEVAAPRYLLLTECSMGDNIAADAPDKEMLRLCSVRCPHMATITLEDTLKALELTRYEVTVPAPIMEKAKLSIDRMMAVT